MDNGRSSNSHVTTNRSSAPRGMTRIELLVQLAIVLVTLGVLLPLLMVGRERARANQCRYQLSQLGLAFQAYADSDPGEAFCQGAFDFLEDGSPDHYSWIASVRTVQGKSKLLDQLSGSTLLCPENPIRGSRVLEDLLQVDTAQLPGVDTSGEPRWSVGMCAPHGELLSTAKGSNARLAAVGRAAADGWNTNYASSWFLVRGQPKLWLSTRNGLTPGGQQKWALSMKTNDTYVGCPRLSHRNCTTGPLTRRMLDNADYPSRSIPLLGDAAATRDSLCLSSSMGWSLPRGSQLASTTGQGPSMWDAKKSNVFTFTAPAPVPAQLLVPVEFPKRGDPVTQVVLAKCVGSSGSTLILQDTRHWSAVHRGKLQLLMADGSVTTLEDKNGDGYINPGFPVVPRQEESAEQLQQRAGYRDNVAEANYWEMFSGTLLS
ncbi:MAG: hypothetical protein B7Z55_13740, partial [Planctomycetales bacterium 12-60-4]